MKKRYLISIAAGLILLVALLGALFWMTPQTSYAEPGAPSGYKITWDVMSYGADKLSSAHYVMDSTIGQTAVIPMHSAHYRLQNGYWGGWWPTIKTFLPNFLRQH